MRVCGRMSVGAAILYTDGSENQRDITPISIDASAQYHSYMTSYPARAFLSSFTIYQIHRIKGHRLLISGGVQL